MQGSSLRPVRRSCETCNTATEPRLKNQSPADQQTPVQDALELFHAAGTDTGSMRNFFTAKVPIPTKIAITTSCTTRNGGSFCVGANAWTAGIFINDCTTATNTFR